MNKQNAWGLNDLMVTAAFRYCLGRKTYIVNVCCNWLEEHWTEFNDQTKQLIHREIDEAISQGKAGH